jgi:hypothetical protein
LIISGITFGLPYLTYLTNKLPFIGSGMSSVIGFIITFMPLWFIFLLSVSADRSKLSKVLAFAYIIFLVAMLITSGYLSQLGETIGVKNLYTPAIATGTSELIKKIPSMPGEIWKSITTATRQQISFATGDYYTGQVEQNQKELLGVYIENIQATDPFFYEGEQVSVWATVMARTIDKEITITPACEADDTTPGDVYLGAGRKNFTIVSLEEQEIECRIPTLSAGSHTVKIDATFDFRTMSYMKTYFMDKNRLRSMLKEGMDPLTEYKITDRAPTAIFTNGPVMIGMDLPTPPIGIDTASIPPTFGVTVSNEWEGKLLRIKKLIIYIPEGFEIITGTPNNVQERGDCTHKFDLYTPTEAEKQEGYIAYKLNPNDPTMQHLPEMQAVSSFQTFKCRLSISNIDNILGTTPITTKYFKATAEYDYITSKSTSVQVKKGLYSAAVPQQIVQLGRMSPQVFLTNLESKKTSDGISYKAVIERQPGGIAHHELVAAVLAGEDPDLDPNAVSSTGCKGLMQFCAQTAYGKDLCGNIDCTSNDRRTDPKLSIEKGSAYLTELKAKFSGKSSQNYFAVASYNVGSAIIIAAIARTGNSDPTWAEVSEKITADFLESTSSESYTGCWASGADNCWTDARRAKTAQDLKTYVSNVVDYYLPAFNGQFK